MFFSYLLWVPNNKAAINVLPASPEAGNHEGPISPILSNLDEIIQQRKTSYARQFCLSIFLDSIFIPFASAFPYYCHSHESCGQHITHLSLSLTRTQFHFQLLWGWTQTSKMNSIVIIFFSGWVSFDWTDRYKERIGNHSV